MNSMQGIHRDVTGASFPKRPRSERSEDLESNHSENSSNLSRSSSFASSYGDATDVGTCYRGGKRSALSRLERRLRKNAQSRSRATKLKDRIEKIKLKPVEERTEEEIQVYSLFEERRQKKNERSRQRAVEKKTEIARIMNIPESDRTEEEKQYLTVNLTAKQRKNEGDRLRRERLKQKKLASMGVKRKDSRRPFYPKYEFPTVAMPPSVATITESTPTAEESMNMEEVEGDRIITEGMRRVDVNNTTVRKSELKSGYEDQSIPSSQTALSSQSMWSDPSSMAASQLTDATSAAPTSPARNSEVFAAQSYHSPTGQDDANFNITSPSFVFPETPNQPQIPQAVTNHDAEMVIDSETNQHNASNQGPQIVMPQRPPPSPIQTGMYAQPGRSTRRLLSLGRRSHESDDRANE